METMKSTSSGGGGVAERSRSSPVRWSGSLASCRGTGVRKVQNASLRGDGIISRGQGISELNRRRNIHVM